MKQWPSKENRWACNRNQAPSNCTKTLLIALTQINSVQTRDIVKTSGFTRGVCKIGASMKFKGFLVEEFLENKRS